jgi:AcrR family transcriptional regulator
MLPRKSRGPRRTSYHHGALRSAVLDAVIEIVRDEGLGAVTMRSVARRAGVSEAAPYHHFESKTDLLAAAAMLAFRELGDAIRAAVESSTSAGDEPVLALAECWIRFGLERRGEYSLMFGRHIVELGLEKRQEVRAVGEAARKLAIAAIADGLRRRRSDVAVHEAFPMVWSCVHGATSLVQERELGADFTMKRSVALVRRTVAALLDGLS